MSYRKALIVATVVITAFACKKEHSSNGQQAPPNNPGPTDILLKDLTINNSSEAWYHFEYDNNKRIVLITSQSSLDTMHVIYDGNRIKEMRNDIIGNHDTLRYAYDNTGMVSLITFIGASADFQYRHIHFTYTGQQLQEIVWDFKDGTRGFKVDRQLSYSYYPDGNVKQVTDYYPPLNSQQEATIIKTFEQYDNKVNVDGFDLLLYYNDHPYLLPGVVLQKNNAMKESVGGDATHLTINWTYQFNNDNLPLSKTGNVTFLSGPEAGHTFVTRHSFTYY
jgi:hypothetical protein